MVTPLLLVVLFSFGENALTNFPMGGVSGKWYERLFDTPEFWKSFHNSLRVAGVVALTSTVVRHPGRAHPVPPAAPGRRPLAHRALLADHDAALVIGVALLVYFVRWVDMGLSLGTVMLGHIVITQPFVILIVYARMATFDYAVQDSARDLGASPWIAFVTVTLPMIRATIVGAALITLAISARRVRDHLLHHRRRQHPAHLRVRQDPDHSRSVHQRHRHHPHRAHHRLDDDRAADQPLPGVGTLNPESGPRPAAVLRREAPPTGRVGSRC